MKTFKYLLNFNRNIFKGVKEKKDMRQLVSQSLMRWSDETRKQFKIYL